MKRLILLTAVTILTALSLHAQRAISGAVIDKDTKEPVMQATVSLLKSDSTLVQNAVTDLDGKFSITATANGGYILRITSVGYTSLFRNITVSDRPLALGTITLTADGILLKEATVIKNQTRMYSKEDTIIYNAGAFKTPEGSVIEELVKRLPGAEVSDDGKITINGKEVNKIKVDGKEFSDTQTAMKNLPTSIVERVKAYDEKSDQTRITGIDDGEELTVLDFGLKRGMNRGSFTNIDLGIGTKHRYSGRLMGMRFKDGLRVMGFTNANNVGDRGFGGGGPGGRFGGGGGRGLSAPKSAAVNMNYEKKDRLKLDGGVRWNHNNSDQWSRTATENFVSRTGAFSNSVSQSYSRSTSWNGNFRVEWTPDTLWNIHFRPSFSWSNNDSRSQSMSASFRKDPYNYVDYALNSHATLQTAIQLMRQAQYADDSLVVNSRDNASLSYSDNNRLGGELQVVRKFGNNGRNITFRLTGNYTEGDSRSLSLQDVNLYQTTMALYDSTYSEYYRNRYNLTPSTNYNYSARLAYSEPIANQTYLQFSYDFQYRYTKNDRSTYDFSEWPTRLVSRGGTFNMDDFDLGYRHWDQNLGMLTETGRTWNSYLDDSLSRFSEYKNYIHTAEVMLRVVRKAYNFNVGVQIVPQTSKFTYRYLGKDYGTTTRNVVNWSPTANFRYKLGEQGQLRFQYRGSTSQPSMTDLLAITDDSDPLNVTVGNAGLKPSFTQNFNFRFNNYYPKHQRFIFTNLNFSTTSNSVTSVVKYEPLTGKRTSTRDNINGNWNTRAEFMFNTALDTLGRFNMNSRTTAAYTHSVSYLDESILDKSLENSHILKNAVNETTLGQRIGFSYRNDWFEFEPNGAVNYTFGRNKLQSSGNQDTWNFSYGFNTTAQLSWGMQITTNLNMTSRRGYSDASMNTNELIWNAQIAQSFLKGRPLSVRLEFYDILGKQSSFSRSLNEMRRSDSETNAINSYVMLRVNYRLNLFGTREARRGMGPDGPREGGPEGGPRGERRGSRGGFGGGGFGGSGRF